MVIIWIFLPKAILPFCRDDDVPLYADGFGFLLIAQNSIDELNCRLKSFGVQDLEVEETRFRPNIFISGTIQFEHLISSNVYISCMCIIVFTNFIFYILGTKNPFDEDSWLYIKIGSCLFRNSALCGRCVFTTVDPRSGEKHPDGEPLKSLKKFR